MSAIIPSDIYSWTTVAEAGALQKLAVNKVCLEIGAFVGFTTVCMAKVATSVYSIDIHQGWEYTKGKESLPDFLHNLSKYRVLNKVVICVGKTTDFASLLPKNHFDLVFIDGDHKYESVKEDIELSLPLLKPGAIISFHDYNHKDHIPVVTAVDEFIIAGTFKPINQVENFLACKLA